MIQLTPPSNSSTFLEVDELSLAEVGRASKVEAGGDVARKVSICEDTAVVHHFFALALAAAGDQLAACQRLFWGGWVRIEVPIPCLQY